MFTTLTTMSKVLIGTTVALGTATIALIHRDKKAAKAVEEPAQTQEAEVEETEATEEAKPEVKATETVKVTKANKKNG